MVCLRILSVLSALVLALLVSSTTAAPRAQQVVKLASSLLYYAKKNNGFVRAFELNRFTSNQYQKVLATVATLATRNCGKKRRDIFGDYGLPVEQSLALEDSIPTEEERSLQGEALRLIDSVEGQMLVVKETIGVKAPVLNITELEKRATLQTWMYYIPSGKLGGRTKPAVLIARVRNAMVNSRIFQLLNKALDDGTARKALQKLCFCSGIGKYNTFMRSG